MKRALKALTALYPKSWRNRYKNEFDALLDDVSPTWRTFFDVLGGAVKMQMQIWSAWKIVAAFGLAGVLLAVGITFMIPKSYISTAVIQIGGNSERQLEDVVIQLESRASLTRRMVAEGLYKAERAQQPLEDVVEQMRKKDILIRAVGGAGAGTYSVSFSSADPGEAQRTTQWLASQFVEAKIATVVDPARLPVVPTNPRPSRNILMGLISGVIAGAFFALFAGLRVWKLAAGLGLAGAIAGAAVAYWLPDRYASMAVMRYVATDQSAAALRVRQLATGVTSDASLGAMVQRLNLYPSEAAGASKLREHLHINTLIDRPGIAITFDDRNRFVAQKVVADVVGRIMEEAVFGGKAPSDIRMTLELLDPPSLPLNPVFPNRPVVAGTGLLFGLACAVGFGLWRYFRGPLPTVTAQ
jgi:LPS O-antigen subunit length determinant protein (WzzB/FepE family)